MSAGSPAATLTVYTAVEAEDLKKYAARFNEDHPDIEIKWVRDSTGIVTAKLLAEKNNPKADVIWGLAATSLLLMKSEGMLHPYKPKGTERLDPRFVDKDDPPAWTGMDAWVASVCVNTVEQAKHGFATPSSWKDLTKPEYKGHVAMPNPNSSGTGFLDVSSWLQMFGEEGGWQFMDALHENINHYTHSRLQALQAGGARRSSDWGLVRIPRREVESGRRADRHHHSVRGHRLGHGSHCDRAGDAEPGCGDDARRLVGR